ncbi:hypothetical protein SNEBB_004799 [Seison nebaliae]|nr:hypothetical protein SNEBB_004799 [Seison nebaliae]
MFSVKFLFFDLLRFRNNLQCRRNEMMKIMKKLFQYLPSHVIEKQILRYHFMEDSTMSLVGRLLELLSLKKICRSDGELDKNVNGKPFFRLRDENEKIAYNISHQKNGLIFAYSHCVNDGNKICDDEYQIGIDLMSLELESEKKSIDETIYRLGKKFSLEEYEDIIKSFDIFERNWKFIRYWTLKEKWN